MKFSKVLLLSLVSGLMATPVPEEDVQPFFKMDFDIHRGNDRSDMGKGRKPGLQKRDSFTMELTNAQTFYLTELQIGSNRDKVDILVDTGSSDLWVMSHDVNCHNNRASKREFIEEEQVTRVEEGVLVKKDLLGAGKFIHVGDTRVLPAHINNSLTPTKSSNVANGFVHGKDIGDELMSFFGFSTQAPQSGGDSSDSGSGSGSSGNNGEGFIGGGGGSGGANTCTSYGSFNTGESESFNRNSSAPDFRIQYADGTTAEGDWGHDDVRIHNVTVRDFSFAIADDTSSNIGVLGIGLPGLEVTYSQGNTNSYQYENLPLKLKNQGVIAKNAYSVYLGDMESETGTILFGAVDHAKYEGTLRTVPIVNTMRSSGYRDPIRLEINLSGVQVAQDTNSAFRAVNDNGYAALLDTGSTLSYFPDGLMSRLADMLDLTLNEQIGGYIIDCNLDDSATISFDFSGINITSPLSDFVMRAAQNTCILGILPQGSGSNYVLLGDNFLRSAYVVYDLDDLTMSLAQVRHTDDEDIEVISSSIPRAEAVSTAATAAFTGGAEGSADSFFDANDDEDNQRASGGSMLYPGYMFAAFTVGLFAVL